MVQVIAVHMVGGERHEHIANLRWRTDGETDHHESTRTQMVTFLESNPGQAYVTDGTMTASIGVVNATPKYVRTYADGVWTDNLLALPRY